ncbi:hypothetical protein NQ317_018787 [Molorchus minor]|uniref:Uncharacterized protein n=1 Tax=Molorchus minor TaxID=1323400 RepID=A0ABQ9J5Z9_9CUCU|nr:hypothetical protein NQ317_018787 [Molorchus minor]
MTREYTPRPLEATHAVVLRQKTACQERVRFDDNVSFITSSQAEKTSIGSSCSFRARCATKPTISKNEKVCDTLSNDSICIDMEEKPRKYSSQAAILRSQFFHSINDARPATKSLDDKTIIEVSNETLDKPSRRLTKCLNR